jgi:hypothetical protein
VLRCGGVELGGVVDVADLCVQAAQLDQSNRMESRFPFFSLLSRASLSFSIRYLRSLLRVADPFLSFLVACLLSLASPRHQLPNLLSLT